MFLSSALMCLALNIYHEARGEPLHGQQAVALVTMNRAGKSPKKVCSVVLKPAQFSWTSEMVFERVLLKVGVPQEMRAWLQAKEVASNVLAGKVADFTGGATHYHSIKVRPKWNWKELSLVMRLGKHRFYRLA